jgi:hypothetical protein
VINKAKRGGSGYGYYGYYRQEREGTAEVLESTAYPGS